MQARRISEKFILFLICITGLLLTYARCQLMLFDYPYMFPDSFDWLVNGLQYSGILGEWQPISHRGMLLTLIYSLFYKLDAINLAPSIGTLSHTMLAAYVLWVPINEFSCRVRVISALFILLSYTLLGQSAYIGADSLANLTVSVSALLLLEFLRDPKPAFLYYLAVICGLGVHSQNIFPILLPTFFFSVVLGISKSSRNTYLRVLCSKHTVWAAIIFALIALSLIVPRLIFYNVFYEERVQHTSLIKLDFGGIRYYIESFLASFSPVICGLSCFGAYRALRRGSKQQDIGLFLALWALNVFGFFSLLYSWRDVRFWIYASTPIYILSAIGLDCILVKIKLRICRYGIVFLCLIIAHCTPSIDPWDTLTTLTPTLAVDFGSGSGGYIRKLHSKPYMYGHFQELRSAWQQSASTGFSSAMRDSALLHSLQNARHRIDSKPLGVFASLSPSDYYIAKNRNTVYASYHVNTLRNFSDVRGFSRNGALIVIPEDKLNELRAMTAGYAHIGSAQQLGINTSPYVIVELNSVEQAAGNEINPLLKIASIDGAVDAHKLADGISNSTDNFATIPFGDVMIARFRSPQDIKSLVIHLWDGDERAYMFGITVIDTKGNRRVLGGIETAHHGSVLLDCDCKAVESLEITGHSNSSVEWIPGNNFLHIKEIELN